MKSLDIDLFMDKSCLIKSECTIFTAPHVFKDNIFNFAASDLFRFYSNAQKFGIDLLCLSLKSKKLQILLNNCDRIFILNNRIQFKVIDQFNV